MAVSRQDILLKIAHINLLHSSSPLSVHGRQKGLKVTHRNTLKGVILLGITPLTVLMSWEMISVCHSQYIIHTLCLHGKDKVAVTPTMVVVVAVTRLVGIEVVARIDTDLALVPDQGTGPQLIDIAHNLVAGASHGA